MRRLIVLAAALVALVAAATAAAAPAVDPLPGTWGGTVTATNGETVTIDISTSFPEDPALQLQWADYMTTLLHGPELADVTVVLTTARGVAIVCGRSALACYLGNTRTLYAPFADVEGEATAKSIVAHEYGHHIARAQSNAPWPAIDWGTKRWATAMGVCAGVRGARLFPGDEGRNYLLNPGEGFAESYRLLNEQLLGLVPTAWMIVDTKLMPSQAALDALRQDVVSPWTGPHVETRTGSFPKNPAVKTKVFTFATPLDGSLAVSIKAPAKTTFRTSYNPSICGKRTTTVTVTRVKGQGAFTLSALIP
jgi:hypothetical protein